MLSDLISETLTVPAKTAFTLEFIIFMVKKNLLLWYVIQL